nr:unknown [Medicago truncatula]
MHWMDARALRRKDAFGGERPWGDTVCDPWISDRETVSKLRG